MGREGRAAASASRGVTAARSSSSASSAATRGSSAPPRAATSSRRPRAPPPLQALVRAARVALGDRCGQEPLRFGQLVARLGGRRRQPLQRAVLELARRGARLLLAASPASRALLHRRRRAAPGSRGARRALAVRELGAQGLIALLAPAEFCGQVGALVEQGLRVGLGLLDARRSAFTSAGSSSSLSVSLSVLRSMPTALSSCVSSFCWRLSRTLSRSCAIGS